jgi:hypothetical protein
MTQTQDPPVLLGTAPTAAEAPDQSGASSLPDSALADLIRDLSEQVSELKRDVQATKSMTPAYKPMERVDPNGAARRREQIDALAHEQKGNADFTSGQNAFVPVTSGYGFEGIMGNRVPENLMNSGQFRKRFSDGDYVRINPDVTREGSERTWGEILEKIGSDGVGVVTQVLGLYKGGIWKYKVRIPKLGTRNATDGYYDRELLPA